MLWAATLHAAARQGRRETSPADAQPTVLHRILREHLETFLARRAEEDAPMPAFVVDERRECLRRGVLAHGTVRFACSACGTDRLVDLSCKGAASAPAASAGA